jgi:hypothetical protein
MSQVSRASSKKWFTIGVAISLSAATFANPISSTMDEPWHSDENPDAIGLKLNHQLGDIYKGTTAAGSLRAVEVKRVPWSGSFWPTFKGSIAHRPSDGQDTAWGWSAPGYHHELLSSDALVASATRSEVDPNDPSITIYSGGALDRVSPVEKLDIAAGRADRKLSDIDYYGNTVRVRVWGKSAMSEAPNQIRWHGLCNGFAAAAIHTTEPKAGDLFSWVYTGENGKKFRFRVRFGSGDLKALASYQYALKTWDATHPGFHQVGLGNCDRATGVGCQGLNAGTFHILMTNIVGVRRESLVFDADPSHEYWNYPVVGYEITRQSLRPYYRANGNTTRWARGNAAEGATHEVRIVMNAHFMGEADWSPFHHASKNRQRVFTRTYEYLVEAAPGADGLAGSADDLVLGGRWLSADRPHFAWRLDAPIEYDGDFKLLNLIWTDGWQQGQ